MWPYFALRTLRATKGDHLLRSSWSPAQPGHRPRGPVLRSAERQRGAKEDGRGGGTRLENFAVGVAALPPEISEAILQAA